MGDDLGFRRRHGCDCGFIGRQRAGLEPDRPGKAPHEQGAADRHAPEREIAEIRVKRRIGMHRKPARLERRHLIRRHKLRDSGHGHARGGLWVGAGRCAGDQQGAARIGLQMPSVFGQRG